MKEQLISFETAKLAKERGFEEFVSYCYLENEELYGTYSLMNEDDSAFIDIMDGNELENHNSSDFDKMLMKLFPLFNYCLNYTVIYTLTCEYTETFYVHHSTDDDDNDDVKPSLFELLLCETHFLFDKHFFYTFYLPSYNLH